MKLKRYLSSLFVLSLLTTFSLHSNADVIVRETEGKGTHFIRIDNVNGQIYFAKCAINENSDCTPIGSENGYLESEIVSLKRIKNLQRNFVAVIGVAASAGVTTIMVGLAALGAPTAGLLVLETALGAQGVFILSGLAYSTYVDVAESHRMAKSLKFVIDGESEEIIVPSVENYEKELTKQLLHRFPKSKAPNLNLG